MDLTSHPHNRDESHIHYARLRSQPEKTIYYIISHIGYSGKGSTGKENRSVSARNWTWGGVTIKWHEGTFCGNGTVPIF